MPAILWLTDRVLRVVGEEGETTVVENADSQGTWEIGGSRHTFAVRHDGF
jgi:hypothetical protein